MDHLWTELSAAVLPGAVALFGTVLTIILNRAASVARERWGIEIEARHREALHAAAMSGLLAALSRGKAGDAAIDAAIDHVTASVPDAVDKLAPRSGVLRSIVEGKLREVIKDAAAR